MDRGKMINHYREPLIDASYLVSVHLAEWLQRRIILKISQSETKVNAPSVLLNEMEASLHPDVY
jgi:hypothetical protein